MDKVIEYLLIIMVGSAEWYALAEVAYIVGLFGIFKKSGIKPAWALAPFARDYMLAKCAGNKKAGKVLLVVDVIIAVFLIIGGTIRISNFAVPAAAITLALVVTKIIYSIRIYRDLVDIYGVSRKWLFLWIPLDGLASLIFGFSKEMQPSVKADQIIEQDEKPKVDEDNIPEHTWGADFVYNIKRLFYHFAFRGDWKSLPIAVAITAIVASIAREDFFLTMEGTIKGSLALTCIAIWNGCFNSILVVCREKGRVRRLCSSGMHLSSFIIPVFLYQALLCLVQTGLTMYTCHLMGIFFPFEGLYITALIFEIGVTVFLITFAADMVSLFISSLVSDSVVAMTIMPFVLVIQLVFSGSIINLETWSRSISKYTISNYGVKCIASQADYNNRPMTLAWTTLKSVRDTRIGSVVNLGDMMDILQNEEDHPAIKQMREMTIGRSFTIGEAKELLFSSSAFNKLLDKDLEIEISVGDLIDMVNDGKSFPAIAELRKKDITKVFTLGEIGDIINSADSMKNLREKKILFGVITVGSALDAILTIFEDTSFTVTINVGEVMDKLLASDNVVAMRDKRPFEGLTIRKILKVTGIEGILDKYSDVEIKAGVNIGQIMDYLLSLDAVQNLRGVDLDLSITVGELIDMIGEENVKKYVIEKTSEVISVPEYEHSRENILHYWKILALFVLIFAAASTAAIIADIQIAKARKAKKS